MEKSEQLRILDEYLDSLRDHFTSKIEGGHVPENWDGHEIRAWVSDKASFEVTDVMRDGRSARVKSFKNDLLVKNL